MREKKKSVVVGYMGCPACKERGKRVRVSVKFIRGINKVRGECPECEAVFTVC